MKQDIPTRLSILKASKKLTNRKLSVMLDVTESTIKNYLTGRTKIPPEKLVMLSEKLNVTLEWILTGRYNTNENKTNILPSRSPAIGTAPSKPVESLLKDKKDYYSHSGVDSLLANEGQANAGLIAYYSFEQMPTLEAPLAKFAIPGFENCSHAFNIAGNSMAPAISSGAVILCSKVTDHTLLVFGEIHFIVTKDFKIARRLKKSKAKDHVLAVAENTNGNYQDIDIPLNKIIDLYIVKGQIERL